MDLDDDIDFDDLRWAFSRVVTGGLKPACYPTMHGYDTSTNFPDGKLVDDKEDPHMAKRAKQFYDIGAQLIFDDGVQAILFLHTAREMGCNFNYTLLNAFIVHNGKGRTEEQLNPPSPSTIGRRLRHYPGCANFHGTLKM